MHHDWKHETVEHLARYARACKLHVTALAAAAFTDSQLARHGMMLC